jgi:hypothetical protein
MKCECFQLRTWCFQRLLACLCFLLSVHNDSEYSKKTVRKGPVAQTVYSDKERKWNVKTVYSHTQRNAWKWENVPCFFFLPQTYFISFHEHILRSLHGRHLLSETVINRNEVWWLPMETSSYYIREKPSLPPKVSTGHAHARTHTHLFLKIRIIISEGSHFVYHKPLYTCRKQVLHII